MQGHESTCACPFGVLLHIAVCTCIAFFVCLPRGAFCFALPSRLFGPEELSAVSLLVWKTQFFRCLPSTIYRPSANSRLFLPFFR